MSPEKFKKLEKLRKKLDKIDNSLLKIIKKRSDIVRKVLQLKSFKKEIVDKKRINIILKNIRKKSIASNIDPKVTNKIWINMIKAYIDFEKRNFKKIILLTVWRQFFFYENFMLFCRWVIFFSF